VGEQEQDERKRDRDDHEGVPGHPDREAPDEHRQQRRRDGRRQQGQPRVAHQVEHAERRAIGAGGEEGGVAEREHAGQAEAEVEAHRIQGPGEDLGPEEPAEPAEHRRQRDEGQQRERLQPRRTPGPAAHG
jgi:hypothetical protein